MKPLDKLATLESYYVLELTSNLGDWYMFTSKLSDLNDTYSFGWLPFEELVATAYDALIDSEEQT